MENITINWKEFENFKVAGLDMTSYIIIKTIRENPIEANIDFFTTLYADATVILTGLQFQMFIKIQEDEIILRSKCDSLFLKKQNSEAIEVLNYLNEKVNKKRGFAANEANLKFINGRLAEKYTVTDLKSVIDKKVKDWKNDKIMKEYLRPETLFNATKFQTYINQVDTKPTEEIGQTFL